MQLAIVFGFESPALVIVSTHLLCAWCDMYSHIKITMLVGTSNRSGYPIWLVQAHHTYFVTFHLPCLCHLQAKHVAAKMWLSSMWLNHAHCSQYPARDYCLLLTSSLHISLTDSGSNKKTLNRFKTACSFQHYRPKLVPRQFALAAALRQL